MQGVEGAQIRHRQEPSRPISGSVERRKRHTINDRADLCLVPPLPHSHATQFGLEKVTRDEPAIGLIKPAQQCPCLRPQIVALVLHNEPEHPV